MNRQNLEITSRLIGQALNLYNDPFIDNVAHEVAHSLLLYGKVFFDMDQAISNRVAAMSNSRANAHEIRACALEIAGLRRLGFKTTTQTVVERAWYSLEKAKKSHKYRTRAVMARAITAETTSPVLVERFVRIYRDFARYARVPRNERKTKT